MNKTAAAILSVLAFCAASFAQAEEPETIEARREARRAAWAAMGIEDYIPPEVKTGTAEELGAWDAPDATQGVAADEKYFYAVANYVIGKYERESGKLVKRWIGKRGGPIGHLNSCYEEAGRLYCANSNHPNLPMASSIEIFDANQPLTAGVTGIEVACQCRDQRAEVQEAAGGGGEAPDVGRGHAG